MTEELDELFSPARLRKKWKKQSTRAGDKSASPENEHPAKACFEKLEQVIANRFIGSDLAVMEQLLGVLQGKLEPVWDRMSEQPVDDINRAEINQLLNDIEDLAEAFTVGRTLKRLHD